MVQLTVIHSNLFTTIENHECVEYFPTQLDSELYQNKGLFGLQQGKLMMTYFFFFFWYC